MKLHEVREVLEVIDADLAGSSFSNVRMAGTIVDDVDLSGIRISDATLANATVTNSTLSGVAISDCRLDGMTIDGIPVTALLDAYRRTS